jgi:hypothetical protein
MALLIRDDRCRRAEGDDLAAVVAARPGLPETDKTGFAAMMTAVVSRWWRPSFRTRVARVGVVGPKRAK